MLLSNSLNRILITRVIIGEILLGLIFIFLNIMTLGLNLDVLPFLEEM